jgi:hypothetical protein
MNKKGYVYHQNWIPIVRQLSLLNHTRTRIFINYLINFELWNGLMFHIAYFRGLFSHTLESNGYSAIDNRLEIGIGLRFK